MPIIRFAFLIPFLILSTVAGCTSSDDRKPQSETDAPSDQAIPGEPTSKTKTVRVRTESLPFLTVEPALSQQQAEPVRAPGRVEFRQQAISSVSAQVAGRVAAIRVQAGDKVRAGDVLMVLHSPDAAATRATLSTARAGLRLAEETAKRQARMLARGVGLELEKLEADRQLTEAKAEFDRASRTSQFLGEGDGAQVSVKAPIAGTVLRVKTTVGAAVEPGSEALLELGDAGTLWIVAEVFERDLSLLGEGDEADVELSVSTRSLRGKVMALGTVFADEQRRAPVYIMLTESALSLRPGMYARVAIQPRQQAHILLPATAVLIKDGKRTVVYVETAEGIYEQRPVAVGESANGKVPVLEGIQPGERVVVRGALLLDGEAEQLL
ncbi:efflux RND transporter periplasmic adaptor subunit [Methylocaldum sp.]|uniref:efflux RND transporter periplasmic adaptor subunit n=1 Tax=Methylocaldum sp. TaxID=1969727 RepID=UPI002D453D8E|nr:efflux RND transporter periplasmic adaptor subunit [Methylocaldum sp.]HYE35400.1 efflux RND transporter periplasmic adaptor subunit [Methylocaldum sp.]